MKITVATWNVNGIRARGLQVRELLDRDAPDVVCLQEIKASPTQVPGILLDLPGYWNHWHGERAYSGVSLHLRRDTFPAEPKFCHPDFDYENRIVLAETPKLTAGSVYVPNGGKDFPAKMRFLEAMEAFVRERVARGAAIVLAGDVNIARTDQDVHPRERKPTIIGQLPEERVVFERIVEAGLSDVARTLDPSNDQLFTWWAPWRNMRQRNIGWRIDYILASAPFASSATACRVLAEYGTSDHAPLVATFELPQPAASGGADVAP